MFFLLNLIFSSFYFILPAYFANMFPVIFAKLSLPLSFPISKKYFGMHKTWRGFYAGYLGALFILFFQVQVQNSYTFFKFHSILNYEEINIFLYAFLFGSGAIIGDCVKSFFKRKFGKNPGEFWFPFDQLDFVIGALIFLIPFFIPDWKIILTILTLTPILHLLINVMAFLTGFKRVWW